LEKVRRGKRMGTGAGDPDAVVTSCKRDVMENREVLGKQRK
jgi:hypothetical protein